jgi:hypothetical protein
MLARILFILAVLAAGAVPVVPPVAAQTLPAATQTQPAKVITVTEPAVMAGNKPAGIVAPATTGSGAYIATAKDKYQVFVFGDSLGAGVWAGLGRMSVGDNRVKFNGRYKESSGFARPDRYDWNGAIEKLLEAKPVDIAIVMLGSNDRQEFRGPGGKFKFGSEDWVNSYSAVLDRFIGQLKAKNVAIYWIGQPPMNEPSYDASVKFISDLQKKRAQLTGVRFIDIRRAFSDDKGQFSWNGPDVDGAVRRMRAKDGVHFYKRGNNKIATLVLKQMNQDLANAGKEGPAAIAALPLDENVEGAQNNATAASAENSIPFFGIEEELAALNVTPPQAEARVQQKAAEAAQTPGAAPAPETKVKTVASYEISPAFETLKANTSPNSPAGKVFVQGIVVAPQAGRVDDATWPRAQ